MKFNVEVDFEEVADEYDLYYEIEQAITKEMTNIVAKEVLKNYNFGKLKDEIKKEMSNELMSELIKSVESKKEFYERVFKVKDFSEVTQANEDYLIELMDKVIAKRFK